MKTQNIKYISLKIKYYFCDIHKVSQTKKSSLEFLKLFNFLDDMCIQTVSLYRIQNSVLPRLPLSDNLKMSDNTVN